MYPSPPSPPSEMHPSYPSERVALNFQNNAILPNLSTVPSLDKSSIELLNENGIVTTDHLVGMFWVKERDVPKFVTYLCDIGIAHGVASECAESFKRKFGGI